MRDCEAHSRSKTGPVSTYVRVIEPTLSDDIADASRTLFHDLVIIAAERVGCDSATHLGAPIELGRRARGVRISQAHDGLVARVESARVEPAIGLAGEVSHRGVAAAGEPIAIEVFAVSQRTKLGESNQHEALIVGGACQDFR